MPDHAQRGEHMECAGDDAAQIAACAASLLHVPLGPGLGGSGATELQVVLARVRDSDGEEGTGFSYSLSGGAEAIRVTVETVVAPAAVGTRLLDWTRVWQQVWSRTHRLGRGVAIPALSAVDIAVWDLRARRAGLPLFRLLGAVREQVPMYGSGRATHQMSTAELVAGSQSYVAEGYRAVKLRVGQHPPETDVARVAAVRAAVGSDVRIMVDANERLDFATALWLGSRLEALDVYWLEEPLPSDDIAGHVRLSERLHFAVAAGEHLIGRFEFAEYARRGAVSILQPDAPLMGGVTEWMRVAVIAEALGLTVAPHFLPELHIHLAAAAPACTYVEHFPLIDELLQETLTVRDGMASPPDRPGHGLLWSSEALKRFQSP